MKEVEWPAQSPDVNPIKDLQDEMKLQAGPYCPTSAKWERIPAARLQSLTEKLPRRAESVTAAY